jgi:hypothetical protein
MQTNPDALSNQPGDLIKWRSDCSGGKRVAPGPLFLDDDVDAPRDLWNKCRQSNPLETNVLNRRISTNRIWVFHGFGRVYEAKLKKGRLTLLPVESALTNPHMTP